MKLAIPTISCRLIPVLVCALLFICAPKCLAQDDPIQKVRPYALAWLALIDTEQYEASYTAAGEGLHQNYPMDKWVLVLKSLKPVQGPVLDRKEIQHTYQPNGIKGLNGECMAIGYSTSFKNMPLAWEYVILRYEDGKWCGVGYSCGPQPSQQGADPSVVQPTTETSTNTVHADH